jgi:hypothetical protein
MIVNYRGGVTSGDLGALHWYDLADMQPHPARTLRFAEVIDIFIGKQTPVFMDQAAAMVYHSLHLSIHHLRYIAVPISID